MAYKYLIHMRLHDVISGEIRGCFNRQARSKPASSDVREGPHVKKGQPPSMPGSRRRPEGRRKSSTSCPRANCGRRVSSFVDTTTVLDRWGSTCTCATSSFPAL